MNPMDAATIMIQKYPGYIPIGYWKRGHEYVIRTQPVRAFQGMSTPTLFVVTKDGTVYGTNPVAINLPVRDMIRF